MIEIYGEEPQLPLRDKMLRLARDISLLELGTGAERIGLEQVKWQPNVPHMFSPPIRLASVTFDGGVYDTSPIKEAKYCIEGPDAFDLIVDREECLADTDPFALHALTAFSSYYHHAHSQCLAAAGRLNLHKLGLDNRLPVAASPVGV